MKVKSLRLNRFRNYDDCTITFGDGTNIIYGNNAQGKTNILEAVYMFSRGKSHRTHNDGELIKFGESFARLEMTWTADDREHKSVMQLAKGGKKLIKTNNIPVRKLSELITRFNVVLFSPDDLDLVKGAPGMRRRYIDSTLSQLYPSYLTSLISYNKTLNQKNSLLRTLKKNHSRDTSTLEVLNELLASEGAHLLKQRAEFVENINKLVYEVGKEISGEELNLTYINGIGIDEFTKQAYLDALNKQLERELDFGASLIGVQRDDINITLGGKNSKQFSSQGQQRTAALSMKIAEADYINEIKDEYPVLLLDDIMSELDQSRRLYLANRIQNKQVLLTCTDKETITTNNTTLFYVEQGVVK